MNKTRMRDQAPSVTQDLPGATRPSSGMSEKAQKSALTSGSVVGALAVSSCCIVPLVLFSMGMTGAWIGGLTALYPYKWYFFVPAAGLIAGGFYMVNRKPDASVSAADCASPISDPDQQDRAVVLDRAGARGLGVPVRRAGPARGGVNWVRLG